MSQTPSSLADISRSQPPEASTVLVRLRHFATRPLSRFLRIQAASGILLLLAAALALACANSPWGDAYAHFWHTPLGLRVGNFYFEKNLEWVVNDGLMVLFFFVVGLEIRREIHQGELSEWRRAVLPVAAALGGMLVPGAIYSVVADAPATRAGWGVPMATDIAFAVGILALLGKRVPPALRVLLLALAVIDDLGAIVVIALFYSSGISVPGLLLAGVGFGLIILLQRLGVRAKLAYLMPALMSWAGIYAAGIHPTIAGVMVGLLTPVQAWLGHDGFVGGVRQELKHLGTRSETSAAPQLATSVQRVHWASAEALSPAENLIEALHPWVAYAIMPLFALANAGVTVSLAAFGEQPSRVTLGVVLGLVLGKPCGIWLACWVAMRFGGARLPSGLGFRHLVVLGVVAGIGFTMSLFVAQLAFSAPELLAAAKVGVLVASGCAALLGLGLGAWLLVPSQTVGAAETEDEAERSTEK